MKFKTVISMLVALLVMFTTSSFALTTSDAPTKLQIPFASSAGGAYIRTVPVASQIGIQNGAASYTDGFPPLNFTPVGAGGVPPFGQDMNGILNAATAIDRWVSAGGAFYYDSAYQTLIGGYPKDACVRSLTTTARTWCSTVNNNTTNPDTGGANWQYPNDAVNATNQSGGTVNATTGAFSGQITSTIATGTAPFVISSTTEVANLHAATATIATNAATQPALTNNTTVATTAYVDKYKGYWTYTANGTWTKPAGADADSLVLIECWGGGGGGSSISTDGGGGGGYSSRVVKMSELASSVGVTIGSGGSVGNPGANGGTSSFGSYVQAGGGGGGQVGSGGGAGGGYYGANHTTPGGGNTPWSTMRMYTVTTETGAASNGDLNPNIFVITTGGADGGKSGTGYGHGSYYGGGGGSSDSAPVGGPSVYGGPGGATGASGSAPGGGGGQGGNGARGEVRVRIL
jgi:hypothetical protein